MLDAVIGNTDRHHENWGILRKRVGDRWQGMVAPTFDHASSLGRELRDEGDGKSRRQILRQKQIGRTQRKRRGRFIGTSRTSAASARWSWFVVPQSRTWIYSSRAWKSWPSWNVRCWKGLSNACQPTGCRHWPANLRLD